MNRTSTKDDGSTVCKVGENVTDDEESNTYESGTENVKPLHGFVRHGKMLRNDQIQ